MTKKVKKPTKLFSVTLAGASNACVKLKVKWLKDKQALADERWHKRELRLARRGTGASMLSISDGLETDADDAGA